MIDHLRNSLKFNKIAAGLSNAANIFLKENIYLFVVRHNYQSFSDSQSILAFQTFFIHAKR